jgi:hypothetical protein
MSGEQNSFDRPLEELPTESITLGQYQRQGGIGSVKRSSGSSFTRSDLVDYAIARQPVGPVVDHDNRADRTIGAGKQWKSFLINTIEVEEYNPYLETAPFEEYPNE